MKDFKYKTVFSSTIKPLVSEDKDKYLAMASLMEVGDFIPDVDTEKNIDLLPVAFNACVVNRVNKNGDVIDTKAAMDICQSFINKPINIEHNRERVIGVILNAGYSEFGTDKVISEDKVANMSGPFNITLGGVIWKIVNNSVTDMIEETSDPTSDEYQKISASWELGFDEFNLVILPENEKNIENGEIIADRNQVEELKEHLRGFGGEGKLSEDRYVYRKVVNHIVPLGIGLTETPAADVEGIATPLTEKKLEKNQSKNNISQSVEENVKNTTIREKIMKINSIKDITDENMENLSASAISDFISQELEKASEEWVTEKTALEDKLDDSTEKNDALSKDQDELKSEMEKVKTSLDEMQTEKAAKEAEEKFNQRMSEIDDEYELNDEDRGVIASDVKDMENEEFEAYSKKLAVLLSSRTRKALEAKAEEEKTAEELAQSETTTEVKSESEAESAEAVIEEAIDQAEEAEQIVPASTEASEPTVYDKYRKAFSYEQFDINE